VAETEPDFQRSVSRLLDDRDYAAALGRNGRRRVADRFLITRYLRDYLNVLSQVGAA
jgi:hypothetical protein